MEKLVIYTPLVSNARILYYVEMSRYLDLFLVTDIKFRYDSEISISNKGSLSIITLGGIKTSHYTTLSYRVFSSLKQLIKSDYIIIEQVFTPNALIFIILLKIFRKRFSASLDGGVKKKEGTLKKCIKSYFLKIPQSIFITGEASKEYLKNYGQNFKTIFYPISSFDIKDYTLAKVNRRFYIDSFDVSSVKTILYVGRITYLKGIDFMNRLIQEPELEFQLLIVGTPDEDSILILNDMIQTQRVSYLGQLSKYDLIKVYTEADVFISPTRVDTWNYTILEALLCGLRVVTSDASGAATSIPPSDCLIIYKSDVYEDFLIKVKTALSKDHSSHCDDKYKLYLTEATVRYYINGLRGINL